MAKKLEAEISLKTHNASRQNKKLRRELEQTGKAGEKAMDGVNKTVDKGSQKTDNFTKSMLKLGGSFLGLAALQRVLSGVIDAYNKAIQLRDEFNAKAATMNAQVAGAAAQFNLSEDVMRRTLTDIGVKAGSDNLGSLADLTVGMSSSGLIGAVNKQGKFGQDDRQKIVQLEQFLQRTGSSGVGGDLAKLVSKGMKGKANNAKNQALVLAQLEAAYKQSQLSNWGEFITGAVSGVSTIAEENISFETGISSYASMAKMTKSGQAAGEQIRMLAEQLFTSDRLAEFIPDYWKKKKENPDGLFREIMDKLTSSSGEEQAAMFDAMNIAPELRGRISRYKGANVERLAIRRAMEAARPETTIAANEAWRVDTRGTRQAGSLKAQSIAAEAGAGRGKSFVAALRAVGAAERKKFEADSPIREGIDSALSLGIDNVQIERSLQSRVIKEFKARGLPARRLTGIDIDLEKDSYEISGISDEDKAIVKQILEELAGSPSPSQNVTINIHKPAVQYNTMPEDTVDTSKYWHHTNMGYD